MTTTVTIEAHCSQTVQVQVRVYESPDNYVETVLQDGEKQTVYVYDQRSVAVAEVPK
jgi:LEA14-like dessication related protein